MLARIAMIATEQSSSMRVNALIFTISPNISACPKDIIIRMNRQVQNYALLCDGSAGGGADRRPKQTASHICNLRQRRAARIPDETEAVTVSIGSGRKTSPLQTRRVLT